MQVHFGPGGYEEIKFAMDALGIRSSLIDEFWLSYITSMNFQPVEHPTEECSRPISPTAALASKVYPERFAYMRRIEFNDPDAEMIVCLLGKDPACKAFRLQVGMSPLTVDAFAMGAYEQVLTFIEKTGKPVCIYLPDHPELISKTAEQHTDLTIIVDHMGLYSNEDRKTFHSPYQDLEYSEVCELFDKVLTLSQYKNVYLKWAHASENFNIPVFPGTRLRPLLRRAIDAFGKERIIWASDFSVNQRGENWSELLYGMLSNNELTYEELAAIMGGNARKLLNWQ